MNKKTVILLAMALSVGVACAGCTDIKTVPSETGTSVTAFTEESKEETTTEATTAESTEETTEGSAKDPDTTETSTEDSKPSTETDPSGEKESKPSKNPDGDGSDKVEGTVVEDDVVVVITDSDDPSTKPSEDQEEPATDPTDDQVEPVNTPSEDQEEPATDPSGDQEVPVTEPSDTTGPDEDINEDDVVVITDPDAAEEYNYSGVTSMPKDDVEKFAKEMKEAYLSGNWEAISTNLRYPFSLHSGETFNDADEFLKYTDGKTASEKDRTDLKYEDCKDIFYNGQGLCLGSGQIWILDLSYMTDAKPDLKIIALAGI